jgi:hypothetical protein
MMLPFSVGRNTDAEHAADVAKRGFDFRRRQQQQLQPLPPMQSSVNYIFAGAQSTEY